MSIPTDRRVAAAATVPVPRPAPAEPVPPYLLRADEVVAEFGADPQRGLTHREAARRLQEVGPNKLTSEKPPSSWVLALGRLRDPMNIMLVVVAIASLLIAQVSTAVLVAALVLLNVVLGSRQELKARASVDALAKLQVPQSRLLREGQLELIPAEEVVPGDIVRVEAGDVVPADGRVIASATLEAQEASLTGESAPISKGAEPLPGPEVALGDRANMLFQNTSVTRGTGAIVVTATGMQTEMGRIATMLGSVTRIRSPLRKELDRLTWVLGIVAWAVVALAVVVGVVRGLPPSDVLLLGTAVAIAAVPTGLPTFVQAVLSYGARQLADAKAVVKNLTDVETLGATSAITTGTTGTLTLGQMTVSTLFVDGAWFVVEGEGYRKTGGVRSVAGAEVPDFTRLAYALVLDSDATVGDDGTVVGDPTEAALVVLAAKLGADAEQTRRAYPRLAEVPFDSDHKFTATFHRIEIDGGDYVVELVKGAPDVVLDRCSRVGGPFRSSWAPIEQERDRIEAANRRMGEQGLRVLAFAARIIAPDDQPMMAVEPMRLTRDLGFVGMVGIIDPLRPSAKAAVETALGAGIDVRMITGDHAVTAHAIGESLGLGEGAVSGAGLQALSDEELRRRLSRLHAFGRVTAEDKLRLARIMQGEGLIVAMTGDAVADAPALKQADVGVAMGSGSEVSKQAARMVLTDDNFGTLVHAVELGRSIYGKVVSYIRYQMTQLLSLVLLFVTATVFNINSGVAMTPLMVLFLNFFVAIFPVVVIMLDPADPDVMNRPPRNPKVPITNAAAVTRWVAYGAVLFVSALVPLIAGPDKPSTDHPSASMTMCYVVVGLGTIFSGLVMRRDPTSGLEPPILSAVTWLSIPVVLLVLSTELNFLQHGLLTQGLSGLQWLACIGLALVLPVVVEIDKWLRRRRLRPTAPQPVPAVVAPARATVVAG